MAAAIRSKNAPIKTYRRVLFRLGDDVAIFVVAFVDRYGCGNEDKVLLDDKTG
jgi:hypothetical protein